MPAALSASNTLRASSAVDTFSSYCDDESDERRLKNELDMSATLNCFSMLMPHLRRALNMALRCSSSVILPFESLSSRLIDR